MNHIMKKKKKLCRNKSKGEREIRDKDKRSQTLSWKWTHIFGEVSFEFSHALAPVGGCFFTNELDVEERALARTEKVAWGGPTHDSRWHIGHQILQERETLPLFT